MTCSLGRNPSMGGTPASERSSRAMVVFWEFGRLGEEV